MGKCESATASIAIKVLLSDLMLQINETNFELIHDMLCKGKIDDDNGDLNELYESIMDDEIPENWLEFKEYLIESFEENESSDTGEFLINKALLVPVKEILTTDRWGYFRTGTNCSYRPIDFDLTADTEKYKDIQKTELVFLLSQTSN